MLDSEKDGMYMSRDKEPDISSGSGGRVLFEWFALTSLVPFRPETLLTIEKHQLAAVDHFEVFQLINDVDILLPSSQFIYLATNEVSCWAPTARRKESRREIWALPCSDTITAAQYDILGPIWSE